MKRGLVLLIALVAISLVAAGYGVAAVVGTTYTVQNGDTVLAPTAKCVVGKNGQNRLDCGLRQGRKHIAAILFPKAVMVTVNGTVRYTCFSNGQCLKS